MEANNAKTFHIVDYIIFILVVIASFLIGVYYALLKQNRTTNEYLMAGRKLNIIPTSVSMLVSFISAISILGNPAETYYYGIDFFFILIGYTIGALVVMVTFIPLLYPLKLTSVNEYFYLRYRAKSVVYLASFLQITMFIFASAAALYAPAVMLQSMWGIPVWMTMLGLGILSTIYTTIGGFKAVIWSDVFQCIVLFGGLLAIVIIGTTKVGSISEIWTIYRDHNRLAPTLSLSPFKRTAFAFAFGFSFNVAFVYGVLQIGVQRYCALQSLQAAQRSALYTIPMSIAIQSLTCISGVVAFAYFTKAGCDPLAATYIKNKNEIIPYFVKEVLNYPTIPGLFVACVFCGSLRF